MIDSWPRCAQIRRQRALALPTLTSALIMYTPGTFSVTVRVAPLFHLGESLVLYHPFEQPYTDPHDALLLPNQQQSSPFCQLGILTRQALTTRCSNEPIAFSSARLLVDPPLRLNSTPDFWPRSCSAFDHRVMPT